MRSFGIFWSHRRLFKDVRLITTVEYSSYIIRTFVLVFQIQTEIQSLDHALPVSFQRNQHDIRVETEQIEKKRFSLTNDGLDSECLRSGMLV